MLSLFQVGLLFEVEDLSVASPATVSRAGMVYLDVSKLGWKPFVATWIVSLGELDGPGQSFLQGLFDKYVDEFLDFKKHECSELIPITDFNAVRSLCNLFKCLATHRM